MNNCGDDATEHDGQRDPAGRIYCHRHPEGWWLPGGASNTGAECLATEFGPAETATLSPEALNSSPTGLVSYPLMRRGERLQYITKAGPGDFMQVAPWVPHQELNASDTEELHCVLVRSGTDELVVNLELDPVAEPEWVELPPHQG